MQITIGSLLHSSANDGDKFFDLRLPPCNAISLGRPPLSNTRSEAGALP